MLPPHHDACSRCNMPPACSRSGGVVMLAFVRSFSLLFALCMTLGFSEDNALANPVPDNVELFEMIKALQAKVASLEADAAKHKQDMISNRTGTQTNAFSPPQVVTASVGDTMQEAQLASETRADHPSPSKLGAPPQTLVPTDNWSGILLGDLAGYWLEQFPNILEGTLRKHFPTNTPPFVTTGITPDFGSRGLR